MGSVETGIERCSKKPPVASQHQKLVEVQKHLVLVPESESEANLSLLLTTICFAQSIRIFIQGMNVPPGSSGFNIDARGMEFCWWRSIQHHSA
jgi:hypothetical protein